MPYIRILLLCLFFTTPILTKNLAVKQFDLSYKISSEPIFYKDFIYSFVDENHFAKITSQGLIEWKIPQEKSKVKQTILRFQRLYMVLYDGSLECYDTKYGYRLWSIENEAIKQIWVYYPNIFFITKEQRLGAIDAISGGILWNNKDEIVNEGILIESKSYFVGVNNREIMKFSTSSGTKIKSTNLETSNLKLIGQNQKKSVILTKKNELIEFNLEKNSFKKIKDIPKSYQLIDSDEMGYIMLDLNKEIIEKGSWENKTPKWVKELKKSEENYKVFSDKEATIILSELGNLDLINNKDGEYLLKQKQLKQLGNTSILGVQISKKNLLFMGQNSLFNVILNKE